MFDGYLAFLVSFRMSYAFSMFTMMLILFVLPVFEFGFEFLGARLVELGVAGFEKVSYKFVETVAACGIN